MSNLAEERFASFDPRGIQAVTRPLGPGGVLKSAHGLGALFEKKTDSPLTAIWRNTHGYF